MPPRRPPRCPRLFPLAALALLAGLAAQAEAKVFTSRCHLAKELLRQNFQRTFISNWVCLIDNESERNTSKIVKKSNGSASYGLFQINSKRWCKTGGKKGGDCNLACESLLDDDITDDSICAYKIFELEGFKSWSGWMRRCKGNRLPDISKCPDFLESARTSPEKERHAAPPPAPPPAPLSAPLHAPLHAPLPTPLSAPLDTTTLLAGLAARTDAKVFTSRCHLAKGLLRQNFQRTFISNWVCLIDNESKRNTSLIVVKSNGSASYGLFQINSKAWCKQRGKKGGKCNLACESLLNDDISNDSICAKKVFEQEGFKFWSGWMRRCKGNKLPDISKCPDFLEWTTPEEERIRSINNHFPLSFP